MTTLEGGMVTCGSQADADHLRVLRAHGWTRDMEGHKPSVPGIDPRFTFVNLGYNLRASEVNAAMGLVQYDKLKTFVSQRRKTANKLKKILSPHVRIQEDRGSSWFGFPIIDKSKRLRLHFEQNGVETRPIICGNIARQPAMDLFQHRVVGDLKYANEVMDYGFAIPCHQAMDDIDITMIEELVGDFYA